MQYTSSHVLGVPRPQPAAAPALNKSLQTQPSLALGGDCARGSDKERENMQPPVSDAGEVLPAPGRDPPGPICGFRAAYHCLSL